MERTIKFRAKLQSRSDNEWRYGFPLIEFSTSTDGEEYVKLYLRNFEICTATKDSHLARRGEEYKSSYSFHVDITTLQVCVDGEWNNCILQTEFTKGYIPHKEFRV